MLQACERRLCHMGLLLLFCFVEYSISLLSKGIMWGSVPNDQMSGGELV